MSLAACLVLPSQMSYPSAGLIFTVRLSVLVVVPFALVVLGELVTSMVPSPVHDASTRLANAVFSLLMKTTSKEILPLNSISSAVPIVASLANLNFGLPLCPCAGCVMVGSAKLLLARLTSLVTTLPEASV